MRDPARIPSVLAEIQAIWEQLPDYRLGQLIANVVSTVDHTDVFDIEDDTLVDAVRAFHLKHG